MEVKSIAQINEELKNIGATELSYLDGVTSAIQTQLNDALGFYDSAHSFSYNGYQKLSNGLIIQWGTAVNSASSIVVTLPIAFPNACLNAHVTDFSAADTNGTSAAALVSGQTTTNLTLSVYTANDNCNWFAIGY